MSDRKKHIILIDDDHGPMRYFVEALEIEGFRVTQIDDTDVAWELVTGQTKRKKPDLFIIDIMMPHGSHLSAIETDDGLLTGYYLINECLKQFPDTPIICLTNLSNASEQFLERCPQDHVKIFEKYDIAPSEFAFEVVRMLEDAPSTSDTVK